MGRVLVCNMTIRSSQTDACICTFRGIPIDDGKHAMCILVLGSCFYIMTQILKFLPSVMFGLNALSNLKLAKTAPMLPHLKDHAHGDPSCTKIEEV